MQVGSGVIMEHVDREPRGIRGVGPSEALHARIRARIAETQAPTTRTNKRVFAAVVAVVALTALVTSGASELVYGRLAAGLVVAPAEELRLVWTSTLLSVLTAGATLAALWRGPRGFGAGATTLALTALIVAAVYSALTLLRPLHLSDAPAANLTISPWGARCALIASIVGVGVMACFAAALRRAAPVATGLRGAAIGVAAGMWASVAVFVFCPSGDSRHLLVGHVLPFLALLGLGAALLPRWLRP
jgi:hypothetical protein